MSLNPKILDDNAKTAFLKRIPIFSGIDKNNFAHIEKITIEKHYNRKEIIFNEGDRGDALYIIVEGQIKISKLYSDGREKTLATLKANDFFGEMSIFDDLPRSATAEATGDKTTILLSIPRRSFELLIMQNPKISLNIMSSLAKRIRHINDQVQDLAFKDVHGRVASAIYTLLKNEREMYQENNKDTNKEKINSLKITHQELANIVGSSRETVTRALNKLKDEGAIEIKHQQIRIEDESILLKYL